ncbi:DUF1566 domain-containing protein [Collimonas fungivorans]|uniref:Lcl C-terminal domain-containing protein n=1 Tax=Collimonas fungivorans (strain Ter331) TaxID=1005048 RepID=G0AAI5_COLFT|nr:DUF1566 domain-containing protein [Collimonas fungivorans]AEK63199.1 conserved hypothetical protein [Collimonas fungivorans Ter331]
MHNVLEFELHGAKVSIPAANLISHWLDKAGLPRNALQQNMLTPPRIGATWIGQGGIYAGILRGENGAPDYHLIHATVEHEMVDMNWVQASEKAAAHIDGHSDWSLPNRREARLLYINSPDGFDTSGWYWTSAQGAAYPDFAWVQYFVHGNQLDGHKSVEYRARAVRRLLVIE